MSKTSLKFLTAVLGILFIAVLALKFKTAPNKTEPLLPYKNGGYPANIKITNEYDTFSFSKLGPGKWEMTAPFKYKADASILETVIYRAKEATHSEMISSGKNNFEDYVEAGAKPLKLKISDRALKPMLSIVIGKPSLSIDGFYYFNLMNMEIREAIGFNTAILKNSFSKWLDKTVLSLEAAKINIIAINSARGALEFRLKNGKWFMEKPVQRELKNDETDKLISPIIDALSYLQADDVIALSGKYGQNPDIETDIIVSIGFSDNSAPVMINFGRQDAHGQRKAKLVGEERVMYLFPKYRWEMFDVNASDTK